MTKLDAESTLADSMTASKNIPIDDEFVNLYTLAASAVASAVFASKPIRWFSLPRGTKQCNNVHDIHLESRIENVAQINSVGEASAFESRNGIHARKKLDGSLVTDADGEAQRIIVNTIRKISEEVRIVGEEDEQTETKYQDSPWENEGVSEEIILETIREEIAKRIADKGMEPSMKIKRKRISIFADPLDGTGCYTKGMFDSVTIMIAIIIDNTPCFGVICKPFGQKGEPTLLDSGSFIMYGGTLLNGSFIAGGSECNRVCLARELEGNEIDESGITFHKQRKAVISKSRFRGVIRECVDAMSDRGLLNKEPLHVSGAGEKALRLIRGSDNASLWFFPKRGTSLWDVAAADAILMAVGGKLTDKDGNNIDYSRSRNNAENEGIIASNDSDLHEECLKMFMEGKWNSDDNKIS